MEVKFSDDFFAIVATRSTQWKIFDTVIAGNINGENIEILIDDQELKY